LTKNDARYAKDKTSPFAREKIKKKDLAQG
jgi:hypothetical protein